ncbi:uncharacterized protein BDV14DRAFT_163932 [Aspergillus stella-maris]|uniref:uncharacterized protein n=1 Tax=Aspergillus stella-maris TaxID=1810926 RepID=UPI003CCCCA6E
MLYPRKDNQPDSSNLRNDTFDTHMRQLWDTWKQPGRAHLSERFTGSISGRGA